MIAAASSKFCDAVAQIAEPERQHAKAGRGERHALPVLGDGRLAEHATERHPRFTQPAARLQLVAEPGIEPSERGVIVGLPQQGLGPAHDG